MKDFSALLKIYTAKNGELFNSSRHVVSENIFKKKCNELDIMVTSNTVSQDYEDAVSFIESKKETKNSFDMVREKITKDMLFKNFIVRGDISGETLVFFKKEEKLHLIGGVLDLDATTIHEITKKVLYHDQVVEWQNILRPYGEFLKINVNNIKEVVKMVWEELYSAEHTMDKELVDFSAAPVLLEGFGKGSQYTIPFSRKHTKFEELNTYTQDFLNRTQDHKYLCAILATRLVGKFKAYVPWLVGEGGEGKTTFFDYLNNLVSGYTATINFSVETPNLTEAIGKTFLFVPDTSKKNLFHYDEVKNVSGYDPQSINAKYKHPVTIKLPGMIIVSSNKIPNIGKYTYAKRRARVFKIQKGDFLETKKELEITDVAQQMAKTNNEFLNYCVQCLEELGNIETGYVPSPPSTHTRDLKTPEEYAYEDFMCLQHIIFGEDRTISGRDLRNLLLKEQKVRGEFFKENFLEYIQSYCEVTFDGDTYKGIGKEDYAKNCYYRGD